MFNGRALSRETHAHREEQLERTPGKKERQNERASLEANRDNWQEDRGRGEGVIAVSRAREAFDGRS